MAAWSPPPLGPYEFHEVVSAMRKTIKLNDEEAAIYWCNVILTFYGKGAPALIAKQLWIMAAEDIDDPVIVLRAFAVFQMAGKVGETDHLFFLVAAMCRAPKWWETPEGRQTDWLWSKAIGDLKSPTRQREIPSFALDRHTKRGWKVFKETGEFDDRFSGTTLGRAKTIYLFLRDKGLSATAKLDPSFAEFWRRRVEVEGMVRGDFEPNDPLIARNRRGPYGPPGECLADGQDDFDAGKNVLFEAGDI